MNERTMIHQIRRFFQPGFGDAVGAELLQEAERQRAEHSELPASAVLIWWPGDSPASMTRLYHHPPGAEAPIALVAGRHTQCDLGVIPGASLRHALILLWPPAGEGESPFTEVIDLGTKTGITLPDGRLAARVAGSGPLRFGVGRADVVVLHALGGEPLPDEPSAVSKLLREFPGQADVTPHSSLPHTRYLDVSESDTLEEESPYDGEKSCVTVLVEGSRDGTFGSEHLMLTQFVSFGQGPVNARVLVRTKDLERGVRLGRYSRCRGSSVLGRHPRVSRVHAFVLDRAGHRWLFDTASTNGTQVVDVDTGAAMGPVRGERTFALHDGQAPSLAGQIALLEIGTPVKPS